MRPEAVRFPAFRTLLMKRFSKRGSHNCRCSAPQSAIDAGTRPLYRWPHQNAGARLGYHRSARSPNMLLRRVVFAASCALCPILAAGDHWSPAEITPVERAYPPEFLLTAEHKMTSRAILGSSTASSLATNEAPLFSSQRHNRLGPHSIETHHNDSRGLRTNSTYRRNSSIDDSATKEKGIARQPAGSSFAVNESHTHGSGLLQSSLASSASRASRNTRLSGCKTSGIQHRARQLQKIRPSSKQCRPERPRERAATVPERTLQSENAASGVRFRPAALAAPPPHGSEARLECCLPALSDNPPVRSS